MVDVAGIWDGAGLANLCRSGFRCERSEASQTGVEPNQESLTLKRLILSAGGDRVPRHEKQWSGSRIPRQKPVEGTDVEDSCDSVDDDDRMGNHR